LNPSRSTASGPAKPGLQQGASRRGRSRWWLLLLIVPGLLVALLWWSLRSESGSAWLLSLVPGLRVNAPQGVLLGDFSAGRVEVALPGGGALVIDGLRWSGLRAEHGSGTWPLAIVIGRLEAAQVEVRSGTASAAGPSTPPTSLALPIELRIDALRVAALKAAALGTTPLRDIRAAVHLGAERGALHRVDGLAFAHDKLRANGVLRIGTREPLPLQAEASVVQEGTLANAAWQASARLTGPLAALQLSATLRAQPSAQPGAPPPAAQTLDLKALLRPFEPWPLGDLDARAQGLDLSAFDARAPLTALSGEARITSEAADRPAQLQARIENTAAGRWNEGRLPLRQLLVELSARPDDPATLDLTKFDAALGSAAQPAGRLQGRGRWARDGWSLEATLAELQPARLDARAAPLPLSGTLSLAGTPPGGPAQSATLRADLGGRVPQRKGTAAARLKLDASATRDAGGDRIELREAVARAGEAVATLAGSAVRAAPEAPWRLQGKARLDRFDPLPWWPGREDSPWRRGPHRLDANGEFDLALPAGAAAAGQGQTRLLALRGRAALQLKDSLLAGVPLRGQAQWRNGDGASAAVEATLESGANRMRATGRVAGPRGSDRWDLELAAPALAAFAPVWRLLRPDVPDATLAGALTATAQVEGRWPALSTRGEARATALQVDRLTLRSAQAQWRAGLQLGAAVEAKVDITGLRQGEATLESAQLRLQGTGRAHRLELDAQTPARPPAWVDALQPGARGGKPGPSVALLRAEGGLTERAGTVDGWRGRVQQLELRGPGAAWLRSGEIVLEAGGFAQAPLRLALQPGRAELLGAALRWERIAWQAADGGTPATLDARATLEPLAIAPILARLQPDFGWGGDLLVGATLEVASAPSVRADIVLQRERGDLTVTEEAGTQALGLTDLRLGLNVADGTWSFTQGLAGSTLGVAAGAFVARTSPQALWPAPETPVSGVLELQVAQLGTWGPWVPAGWRLGGALRVSAGIGGTFGGPEYTGEMRGSKLSVRNFVQGVNVSDGEVAIALRGATARIERFSARGGAGTLQLEGEATLGSAPQARLTVAARQFQLLGRVDRRIVASGDARLQLERDRLQLDGQFGIDEGLIDFTRSDAPTLADDVLVVRANGAPTAAPEANGSSSGAATARLPTVALDLRVGLGERLRVRGRGLDTRLAGDLRITSPAGRMAVDGTVRALDGSYAAYGQKLAIDRGNLTFNGPAENPRLDIEATRPNLDVRVGVAVTGTAANPRVRLFSEPEMSEIDKLSWLVLGRASDGLGRTDTALLQRAALALLAGDRPGPTDPLMQAIGLDELSVSQSDGEVRETVVSLGKQLSRRWYVGYERSLNATAGTWQLIYRVAQRFTLRAQSGEDSALDVIWTWRWN
jgi:translocation and assembly module TamB